MITVVLWKWGDKYSSAHVNRLARAITKHLHVPHEIACITDDATDLDSNIRVFPLRYVWGKRHLRRLWIFSDDAAALGATLLQIDLDMIITDDISSLVTDFVAHVHQPGHDFRIWKCKMANRYGFGLNPSFMMLQSGAYSSIWRSLQRSPDRALFEANRRGWPASDQAVISHLFTALQEPNRARPICPIWDDLDGIISLRDELKHVAQAPSLYRHAPLPASTRIVSFHGRFDPSQFTEVDWVRQHWSDLQNLL